MRLLKPMITRTMVAAVDVVVSLLPTSRLTVTEPITQRRSLGVVAAWVCVAVEAWVLVATRVRSCKLSKTIMTATICFKFGGSRGSSEVRYPLFFEQCASPTADGRGLSWLGYQHHAGYRRRGTIAVCSQVLERRSSLWENG